jgi:glycerol-3-phosphate dehydrogenase
MSPIDGTASGGSYAAAGAAGATAAAATGDEPPNPLDTTADAVPDTAERMADALARRAELLLLAVNSRQHALQARLDRMRAEFNATQEERSEKMREMNMLRDMAMEQAKHDDEILKKFIAMI